MDHHSKVLFGELGCESAERVVERHRPFARAHYENQKSLEILQLPMIGAIPCSCEILNAEGKFFFAAEKPNHPFTKTLEKIATKIEHHQLQPEHLLTATQLYTE